MKIPPGLGPSTLEEFRPRTTPPPRRIRRSAPGVAPPPPAERFQHSGKYSDHYHSEYLPKLMAKQHLHFCTEFIGWEISPLPIVEANSYPPPLNQIPPTRIRTWVFTWVVVRYLVVINNHINSAKTPKSLYSTYVQWSDLCDLCSVTPWWRYVVIH